MENQNNTLNNPLDPFRISSNSSNDRASKVLDKMKEDNSITDYGFSPDPFCVYDGWFESSNGNKYIFEIKDRNYPHNHFKDGWMLEEKKRAAMEKERIALEYKGSVYINTFTDSIGLVWVLTNLSFGKPHSVEAVATSAVRGRIVEKPTHNLLVSQAHRKYTI